MIRVAVGLFAVCALIYLAVAQVPMTDENPRLGTRPAPEFPAGLDWLNVERPLSLADLEGKIVLLDFLTYGCINCIHVIPGLHALEEKYADELVVVGVHSAKFDQESETENIRRFLERYEIEHPMVNDNEFEIWRSYGINAWPSFTLIDTEGRIAGGHVGEGVYDALDERIGELVSASDELGLLDRRPIEALSPGRDQPGSPLRFPGFVLADEQGERLFIADTNHHRIVATDLDGEVLDVIGSGESGFEDGNRYEARFLRPMGMALADSDTLYVADSGNHSIRRIDLREGTVSTVAGTGEQEYLFGVRDAEARTRGLNSPWDLQYLAGQLYIAMAGQHQLWRYDPEREAISLHAGSGYEALRDGLLLQAGLNQPTGLTSDGARLFVADSEASAVRAVDLAADGSIETVVGTGLFDFGDVDGQGDEVRLQHPADVAFHDDRVFIADTYNHKIKLLDPATNEVSTFLGSGASGWRDGAEPLFFEPGGVSIAADRLYIADTNNHAIRVADLGSRDVHTLTLEDPRGLLGRSDEGEFFGPMITLEPQRVEAGEGLVQLEVILPRSYKVNTLAPFSVEWSVDGEAVVIGPGDLRTVIAEPSYPLTVDVPASFLASASGQGVVTRATVRADVTTYYCREGAEALCLVDDVRLLAPVEVAPDGDDTPGERLVRLARQPPPVPDQRQ